MPARRKDGRGAAGLTATGRARWLAVWLVLAAVYLAVWALSHRLLAGTFAASAQDLVHLALVPLAQTATLALVAFLRRR